MVPTENEMCKYIYPLLQIFNKNDSQLSMWLKHFLHCTNNLWQKCISSYSVLQNPNWICKETMLSLLCTVW